MTDKPQFTVIDRRKAKAEEEQNASSTTSPNTPPSAEVQAPENMRTEEHPSPGPQLVTSDSVKHSKTPDEPQEPGAALPPPPTADESRTQKTAYDASSQRLDDLVRAQNPGAGAQPPVTFESLLQQLYVAAMMQMGAGTPEGERPRIDILGARQTIDLLALLAVKTHGNLTAGEDSALQSVVFEARMAFLELTKMITLQGVGAPPPPPTAKH